MKLTIKAINLVILCGIAMTSLNSCAAVAATAGGGVAYATDPRSSSQMSTDHDLKSAVKDKLDVVLAKNNIEVTGYNNKVLLTGQVISKANSDIATQVAESTPLVKQVFNYIEISPEDNASYTSDTYITSKVKSSAFVTVGIDSNNMKVITYHGSVYLFGITTKSQGERLVTLSKSISGVKNVIPLFDYVN